MEDSPFSTRRAFLQRTIVAGLLTSAASGAKAEPTTSSPQFIDTNAYLGRWPIRHLPLADPAPLAVKLKSQDITEAWVSSLDALLHKDLAEVNARTADICTLHAIFRPVGSVNPTLPRWENDIERCANQHHMRVIRLHPNYHNYTLDDPRFVELLKLASAHRLAVQIAVVMEDDRTQPALWRVPPVNVAPLPQALALAPQARVMLLNWQRTTSRGPTIPLLKNTQVMFDIAMLEGMAGIEGLLHELPIERLVFGSYAPVFYFESAKLKLQESALDGKHFNAITHENAARFLGT